MDLGLFIAASGMVAEQTRQDQLSNDLANASTPGYKPDSTPQRSFGEMLLRNSASGQAIGTMNTGVALGKTYTDMAPAGMQSTNEPLDFGIVGVNDINPTSAAVPFGGIKESGVGREGARQGIHEYLDTKVCGIAI